MILHVSYQVNIYQTHLCSTCDTLQSYDAKHTNLQGIIPVNSVAISSQLGNVARVNYRKTAKLKEVETAWLPICPGASHM